MTAAEFDEQKLPDTYRCEDCAFFRSCEIQFEQPPHSEHCALIPIGFVRRGIVEVDT